MAVQKRKTRKAVDQSPAEDIDKKVSVKPTEVAESNLEDTTTPVAAAATPLQAPSNKISAGDFIETIEVQLGLIVLIIVDLICAGADMYFKEKQRADKLVLLTPELEEVAIATGANAAAMLLQRLIESFSGFTIFFFLLELGLLLVTFKKNFFAHIGYTMDLILVGSMVLAEIRSPFKGYRLLGFFRLWRVFRLINTLLNVERKRHEDTKTDLSQEKTKLLTLEMEKKAVQDTLRREYESRGSLEKLLQRYKDEVDTLKEALNIAAQAVAEASMGAEMVYSTEESPEIESNNEMYSKLSPLPEEQQQEDEDAFTDAIEQEA